MSELHNASASADPASAAKVQALLAQRPELASSRDEFGRLPHHLAAAYGRSSTLRLLLDAHPAGAQVVEIGPINASIHQIDEHVRLADLDPLARIYEGVLRRLLVDQPA